MRSVLLRAAIAACVGAMLSGCVYEAPPPGPAYGYGYGYNGYDPGQRAVAGGLVGAGAGAALGAVAGGGRGAAIGALAGGAVGAAAGASSTPPPPAYGAGYSPYGSGYYPEY